MSTGLKATAQTLAYAQYTSTSSAFALTASPATGSALPSSDPAGANPRPNFVLLQAETQDIRWRGDGSAPTASVGMVLTAGDAPFPYDGDLQNLKLIAVTSGAILNVHYFV